MRPDPLHPHNGACGELHLVPDAMRWHNPPAHWAQDAAGGLSLRTQPGTDFWQATHYGFRRDNGHLLAYLAAADFRCELALRFEPGSQYDQAGLMVRQGPDCWIKASIEYEPEGCSRLGAVVTNAGYSDWSTQDVPRAMSALSLQMIRTGADFIIHWRPDATRPWSQLRIAHLHVPPDAPLWIGPYACAPTGPGFTAHFEHFALRI